MALSTGPMLAVGGITLANQVVFHNQPINWRVPIATGIAAGFLAIIEKGNEGLAVGLAWLALLTVLVARTDKNVKAPMESLLEWWEGK